jgi:hypothetical protein
VVSTTDQLPGGTYSAQAHYAGDGTYMPGDSNPVLITILPESTQTTVSAVSGTPPVFVPFTSGAYGTPIYLQSTVLSNSQVGTPTGQVNFTDSAGTALPPGFVNSQHIFTAGPISNFAIGSHSITATYSGDESFKSSTSSTVAPFTITQAATSTTVQPPATPFLASTPQSIQVVVSSSSAGVAPTGTVTLFNGAAVIGPPVAVVPSGSTASASASFQVNLPPGMTTLSAKYNGDQNYSSSTSAPISINAFRSSTFAVTSSNLTIQQSTSVTFTATLTPTLSGGPAITGTIQFSSNIVSAPLCTVSVSNAQAQCTTSALPLGLNDIFANYSGDSNYAPNNTEIQEEVNAGPDFSVVANPASITIAKPGKPGSTSLTLSAMNGLTGSFNLVPQCAGLPSESTCSVSPTSITFSSTMTTANVMLTISTTAPSSIAPNRRLRSPGAGNRIGTAIAIGLLALSSLLGMLRTRRKFEFVLAATVLAALLTFAACGGGGGGGGGVHDPGTPVGLDAGASVSFTLGSATHSAPFSVNVQ